MVYSGYTPFERMLISRGGRSAELGRRIYAIRIRAPPSIPSRPPIPPSKPSAPPPKPSVVEPEKEPEKATLPPKSALGRMITRHPESPIARMVTRIKERKEKEKPEPITAEPILPTTTPTTVEQKVDGLPDLRTMAPSIIDFSKYKPPDTTKIPIQPTYTYGTGTPEQLPKTADIGFYKPSVMEARHEKMALKKGYTIGRDPETKKPITIQQTEASYFHDYEPGFDDPKVRRTYTKVEENIGKNLEIAESNIEIAKQAKDNISEVGKIIKQLENAPRGTTVTYTETLPSGEIVEHKDVSPQKALVFFRSHLSDLQNTADQYSSNVKAVKDLKNQQSIISGYKKYGYVLTETDTGYSVGTPKSSDVYLWKHGEKLSGVALSSAAFLASPLAIETVGSAIYYAITKDKKVSESEKERLSEYALGLDVAIAKDQYFEKVVSSPAMVEGVYLPILTFGVAKGISMGVSGVSPYVLSGAGKVSTTFTKLVGHVPSKVQTVITVAKEPVVWAGKGALRFTGTLPGRQTVKYGLYLGLEGKPLLETAAMHPERFGGVLGRSLFGWELQWRAMELGFKGTEFPRRKWVEKDIFEVKGLPSTVREQKLVGRIDVVQRPLEKAKSEFRAVGKTLVKTEGAKPIKVYVEAKGIAETYPTLKYTETTGVGKFKWKEVVGLKKYEYISFRPFESSQIELAKIGKERIIYSVEKTMGKIEPYTGETLTRALRISEAKKLSLDAYVAHGKYANIIEDIIGEHRLAGFVYGLEKAKKPVIDVGGRLVQELSTITESKLFVPMKLIVTKPVETISTGIGVGISKTVTKTITEPVDVAKTYLGDTTILKTTDKTITVVGGKLVSKPKDVLDTSLKMILVTKTKTDYLKKIDLGEGIILETEKLQKTGMGLLPVTGTKFDIFEEQKDIITPVQILDVGVTQAQKQRQALLTRQKTMLETELESLATMSITPTPTPMISEMKIPILIPPRDKKDGVERLIGKKPTGKGFDVYVKERSMYHGKIVKPTKFKKVNVDALTKHDALSLGATIADETAAISFKIEPTDEKPGKPSGRSRSFSDIGHKFTKKGEVYIEKNKYRLDTPGEQREISLLGRETRRMKLLGNKKSKKKREKKNVRYI